MQPSSSNQIEEVLNRTWPWSAWLTIVAVVLVILVVGLLYFTERGQASSPRRSVLIALRVTALLLVGWMLAGWSIERYQTDRPDLVLLVDTSASMQTLDALPGKSTGNEPRSTRWESISQVIRKAWSGSAAQSLDRYRVKLYGIADQASAIPLPADAASTSVTPAESLVESLVDSLAQHMPDGQQSRLGDSLIQVLQRQSGRPTAAVVLFSDGIVTSGAPLAEAVAHARRSNIPIICIATGQQLPQPDLGLLDLLADDAVYLGDRVNVQVNLAATDIDRHTAVVNLRDMQSGQVLDSAQVELTGQRSMTGVQLSFVPKTAGNMLIKLEVVAAPGEKNLENNSLERAIDVRDQTLRVLLVQQVPSFEYRFLKTLLERLSNLADRDQRAFEVDAVLQDADAAHVAQDTNALRLVPGDAETIASYDVVIIGQVDPALIASSTQQLLVDQVTTAGCGVIFICHPDFDSSQLAGWPLGKLLPIDARPLTDRGGSRSWQYDGSPLRWQPTTLGQTALPLQLSEGGQRDGLWNMLPGPQWYYRPGALKPGAQILAVATAGGVGAAGNDTGQAPLLVSQFMGAGRVVLQTTDETYRWYSFRGSEIVYERYWVQMLRWLARGKLNRQNQTELVVEPRQAKLGEPLQFQVRLSSELAATMNASECEVSVQRMGGQARNLTLSRTPGATSEFKATESQLPAGSYRAYLSRPADTGVNSVTFTITAPPGEQANLRSDWSGLQALAEQTRGRFATAAQADEMLQRLPKGNPVRRGALPPLPIWNSWWIALLLVSILTAEWILRRTSNML